MMPASGMVIPIFWRHFPGQTCRNHTGATADHNVTPPLELWRVWLRAVAVLLRDVAPAFSKAKPPTLSKLSPPPPLTTHTLPPPILLPAVAVRPQSSSLLDRSLEILDRVARGCSTGSPLCRYQ